MSPLQMLGLLRSFALALLVQENVVAMLEDDTFLLTDPWGGNGVLSNANNSPCPQPRAKAALCISLAPASPNTLHAHSTSLFCPPFSFIFFSFSIGKNQQEFLDSLVSRRPWLSLQVPVQHICIPCTTHKFLIVSGLQEEGSMCTFSLATNLGKCPNSPTSLCLLRRVVSRAPWPRLVAML